MPPLPPYTPFPLPFLIGTDICNVSRIVGLLKGSSADRFLKRVLRPEEREDCSVEDAVRRYSDAKRRLERKRFVVERMGKATVRDREREKSDRQTLGVGEDVDVGQGDVGGWSAAGGRKLDLTGREKSIIRYTFEDEVDENPKAVWKQKRAADEQRKAWHQGEFISAWRSIAGFSGTITRSSARQVSPPGGRTGSRRMSSFFEDAGRLFGIEKVTEEGEVKGENDKGGNKGAVKEETRSEMDETKNETGAATTSIPDEGPLLDSAADENTPNEQLLIDSNDHQEKAVEKGWEILELHDIKNDTEAAFSIPDPDPLLELAVEKNIPEKKFSRAEKDQQERKVGGNSRENSDSEEVQSETEAPESILDQSPAMAAAEASSKQQMLMEEKDQEELGIKKNEVGSEMEEIGSPTGILESIPVPLLGHSAEHKIPRHMWGDTAFVRNLFRRAEGESIQAWQMRLCRLSCQAPSVNRTGRWLRRRLVRLMEKEEESIPDENRAEWMERNLAQREEYMQMIRATHENSWLNMVAEITKGDERGMLREKDAAVDATDYLKKTVKGETDWKQGAGDAARKHRLSKGQKEKTNFAELEALERSTPTPPTPSTTESSAEPSVKPATKTSTCSDLDKPAGMYSKHIGAQRATKDRRVAEAEPKAKAGILVRYYNPSKVVENKDEMKRLDSELSRKSAGLRHMMRGMGIMVSHKEAEILVKEEFGMVQTPVVQSEERVSVRRVQAGRLGEEEQNRPQVQQTEVLGGSQAQVQPEAPQVEAEKLGEDPGSVQTPVLEETPAELDTVTDSEQTLAELEWEMVLAEKELLKAARFLAGRFAAKEAVMKAHSPGRLTYHSILILKPQRAPGQSGSLAPVALILPSDMWTPEGPEETELEATWMKSVWGGRKAQEVRISISHDGNYATAVAMVADDREGRTREFGVTSDGETRRTE